MAIKPLRMSTTVNVVWPFDPAFDQEHKVDGVLASAAYLRQAPKDPSSWQRLLKQTGTDAPTEFQIGPMTVDEINRLSDEAALLVVSPDGTKAIEKRESRLHWGAFMASLRGLKNGPTNEAGEVPMRGERVNPDWLKTAFAGPVLRTAALCIGSIAWEWNNYTDADAKNW